MITNEKLIDLVKLKDTKATLTKRLGDYMYIKDLIYTFDPVWIKFLHMTRVYLYVLL